MQRNGNANYWCDEEDEELQKEEVDYTEEFLQALVNAMSAYCLMNALVNFSGRDPIAKLFCLRVGPQNGLGEKPAFIKSDVTQTVLMVPVLSVVA